MGKWEGRDFWFSQVLGGQCEGSLAVLGPWQALGRYPLVKIKRAFHFHGGQCLGRVFQPKEKSLVNSAFPAWSPEASLPDGVWDAVPRATQVSPSTQAGYSLRPHTTAEGPPDPDTHHN